MNFYEKDNFNNFKVVLAMLNIWILSLYINLKKETNALALSLVTLALI